MPPSSYAVLLVALSGCSFIAAHGPGQPTATGHVPCSGALAAPIVDTVLATGAAVAMFALPAAPQEDDPNAVYRGLLPIGATFYALGALVGYLNVHTCHELRRAELQRADSEPEPSVTGFRPRAP